MTGAAVALVVSVVLSVASIGLCVDTARMRRRIARLQREAISRQV